MEVIKDNDGFLIRQKQFIGKTLEKYNLQDAKPAKYPLEPSYGKTESPPMRDNKEYQSLIGSLLYIAVNTRPDIAASIAILSQKTSNPSQEDWNELKRVVKYLKGTAEMFLKLNNDISLEEKSLIGFADANWAESRIDRKSNSGYVFMLNGGCVSWACRKQTCVSLSTTEAEFIALSESAKEATWIRNLLIDLQYSQELPTTIYEDNQSCLNLIKDERLSNRSKHIDTKFHFVKDYIMKGIITCKYCPSEEMLADMLTKPLSGSKLKYFREKSGIVRK